MKSMKRAAFAVIGVAASLSLVACAAPQQGGNTGGDNPDDVAEIPSTVQIMVPFSAGGGTDTWARFIAPYLQEHVEGEPKIVTENVPGGGSITGANDFVRNGGIAGEQLLVTSGSTYLPALLGQTEVEYDFTKMIPLMVNGTGGVVYAAPSTGIETVEDLKEFDDSLSYGGISATGLDLVTLLALDVLGIDIDATFGFEGRGPARLAFERGEVNLDYQTTSAFNTQVRPLIEEGKAVPLFSFGVLEDGEVVRDPALPDLPTLEEAFENINGEAPTGSAYEAYRAFLTAGFFYQKGIWANDGTPESIVTAFQDAAVEIAEDDDFLAKSEDILGGYPLISGAVAEKPLAEAFALDDSVRQYALDLLADEYDTVVNTK